MKNAEPTITNENATGIQFPVDRREYFAAAALTGLLSDPTNMSKTNDFVKCAYMIADAMIEAGRKP